MFILVVVIIANDVITRLTETFDVFLQLLFLLEQSITS